MGVLKTISIAVLVLLNVLVFGGQQRHFTRIDVEYVLDLPSPAWQVVSAIDVHDHPDFINGSDPANGFLRLRKIFVDRPANAAELFRQQEKWELQRLPGYVVCTACEGMRFDGLLHATTFSYEYVSSGRAMYGRIYYLQIDQYSYYSLHFTVARDRLSAISEDMDSIVRSFHLK